MPIIIKDVDSGLGNTIFYRGVVTEQEFVDVIKRHLTQDKYKFMKFS